MPGHWSNDEVEEIVADYFAMLRLELAHTPFNKKSRYRALAKRLTGRSEKSIEWKHENISAVLRDHNKPFIDGLKPAANYQGLLEQKTLEWLEGEPEFFEAAATSPIVNPRALPITDFADIESLVEPPPTEPKARRSDGVRRPPVKGIDFVRRDAENARLGRLGEEWVLEFERRRLHDVERRADLARQVVWVSRDEGDGSGYDIRSFERNGDRRLIEVNTTGLGKHFPFYVSANEVRVSRQVAKAYRLYRVFRFSTEPRLYQLRGALDSACRLTPVIFSALPAKQA